MYFTVVESIMRGEDVGITPRRSRSSTAPTLPLVPQNIVSIQCFAKHRLTLLISDISQIADHFVKTRKLFFSNFVYVLVLKHFNLFLLFIKIV